MERRMELAGIAIFDTYLVFPKSVLVTFYGSPHLLLRKYRQKLLTKHRETGIINREDIRCRRISSLEDVTTR